MADQAILCSQKWIPKAQRMLCLVPLPEGDRTPLLATLLIAEPHVVIPKESKPARGRAGLRTRETSVTRSGETHTSSTHKDDVEEVKGEGDPTFKGKRAASGDAEEEAWQEGLQRPRKASAPSVSQPAMPEKASFPDELDEDLLELGREKPAPWRYVIVTISGL